MRNFKGEEPDVGAVLGTAAEQGETKDRFKFFQDKLLAYVKRSGSYKYPDDLAVLIRKLKDPFPVLQTSKPAKPSVAELEDDAFKMEYGHKLKLYVEREMTLRVNMSNLYSLIWGQLTEALKSRIKGDPDFDDKDDVSDALWSHERPIYSVLFLSSFLLKIPGFFL